MRRHLRRRWLCSLAMLAVLEPLPGRAALDQACTTSQTPETIWLGDALSQSFTPSGPDVARIDVRLLFRRSFAGRIDAVLRLRAPTEVLADEVAVAGPVLATMSRTVSSPPGRAHWVPFVLDDPVAVPAGAAWPLLEVEVRPGRDDPPWGWTQCRRAYAGGRAYGRAPIPLDGTQLPNDHVNFDLADRDFQFRVHTS